MNLCVRNCEIETYSSQLQSYIKRLQLTQILEEAPLSDIFNNDYQSRVSYDPFAEDTPAWDTTMRLIFEEIIYT